MSATRLEPVPLTGIVNLASVTAMRREAVARGRSVFADSNAGSANGVLIYDLKDLEVEGSAVITLLLSILREFRNDRQRIEVLFENPSSKLVSIAEASGV